MRDRWEQRRFGGPGARGLGGREGGDTLGGGGVGWEPGTREHTYIIYIYIYIFVCMCTSTCIDIYIYIYIDIDADRQAVRQTDIEREREDSRHCL